MSRVFDRNSDNYLGIFADMVPDYPFTFSLWVKAVDVTTTGGFFTYNLTSSKYIATAYSWSGPIRYEARPTTNNSKAIGVSSNSPVNDTWHLVVIRGLDSSTANSFVLDTLGEQVTLTPVGPAITPASPKLVIGKNSGNGPHDGKIAGMAVWDRYLTDIEVAELEQGVRPNEIAGADCVPSIRIYVAKASTTIYFCRTVEAVA